MSQLKLELAVARQGVAREEEDAAHANPLASGSGVAGEGPIVLDENGELRAEPGGNAEGAGSGGGDGGGGGDGDGGGEVLTLTSSSKRAVVRKLAAEKVGAGSHMPYYCPCACFA